ncbi:MAG: Crp/Fnr family transcriptional regulator [Cyanobacteria bacterium J06631_2]
MSDSDPSGNQLLSAFSLSVYQQLSIFIEEVDLISGEVVHPSYQIVSEVYFPLTAIFSSVIKMADGSTSEVAMIGNEGLVGLSAVLGNTLVATNSVVLVSGKAMKLSTQVVREQFQQDSRLQLLLLLYAQAYIAQISHISACNSLHNVEQRLARFLLLVHDCIGQEKLSLTQKTIALMLGVRRASITETALSFQSRKIIRYSRGKITICDRQKLEEIACECYGKIKSDYSNLVQQELPDHPDNI